MTTKTKLYLLAYVSLAGFIANWDNWVGVGFCATAIALFLIGDKSNGR
jgi:hypothetical protein